MTDTEKINELEKRVAELEKQVKELQKTLEKIHNPNSLRGAGLNLSDI